MAIKFPEIVSNSTKLGPYCNFIEYSAYTNNQIQFNEFDLDDGGLELNDIKRELERRLSLYLPFIPYEIKKDKVVSLVDNKLKYLHYFYCLYYSIQGGNSKTSNTNLFERITDFALKKYFSTDKSCITSIGLNTHNLINSIEGIRSQLLEDKGNFQNIRVEAKDGGIDIITFKPIDHRGNQLVCLTDATIGRNWKREKKVLSKLRHWLQFIHFKVSPITCLSVVHVIDDIEFHGCSNDNGLMFDRTRIMKYCTMDSVLVRDLKLWLKNL